MWCCTWRHGIFCAVLFVQASCAVIHERTSPAQLTTARMAAWEVHHARLDQLSNWKLKGRIAGKSNNEGFRAGVRWHQQQQAFSIDLLGPLGRKVAVISVQDGQVQLDTSKGEHYVAQDPEMLMQDLFGFALPVNGLHYWVRGVPDPGQDYSIQALDEQGRLKRLRQSGWDIGYERYHEGNPALPAFIRIKGPVLSAKIIIDKWFRNAATL